MVFQVGQPAFNQYGRAYIEVDQSDIFYKVHEFEEGVPKGKKVYENEGPEKK